MTEAVQKRLADSLTTSMSSTKEVIMDVDLESLVYQDPHWEIRDVLWHLAVWDRQVTKSINAYLAGAVYVIDNFEEDRFNHEAFLEGRQLSDEKILAEFIAARQKFKDAVLDFPVDKYPVEFLYPWGDERGDIATLVDYMVEHDQEHREEIRKAITG